MLCTLSGCCYRVFKYWLSSVGISGSYPKPSGQFILLDGTLKHQRAEVCGLADTFIPML